MVLVVVLTGINCFGQDLSDTIHAVDKTLGLAYYQHRKPLNYRQLAEMMKSNDLAYKHIKRAKRNQNTSLLFQYAGGFLIGYPIGTMIAGGDPNWVLAGIGGGLILLSIPFVTSSMENGKQAVQYYNERIQSDVGYRRKPQFEVGVTQNGIGIVVRL